MKTLKEIAELVNGAVAGDETIKIKGVSGIEDAGEGDITFLANPRYSHFLERTAASAVITGRDIPAGKKPLIRVDNPSLAFTQVVALLFPEKKSTIHGVHKTCVIGEKAKIAKDAALGPFVTIEPGVTVGAGTAIHAGTYVGHDSVIGKGCLIYPGVTIRERTEIGDNVIIHSGAVLGSDGFGFITIEGKHQKIPQLGHVVIEDDVEIGANVTIDRARFDRTVVGAGTKIDNLVHIAHNVIIGKNCLIVAQVGISGSTTIGDNVILAGQAAVVGHVTIGDNCVVMARSGISKDLPAGSVVWGSPSAPAQEAKKIFVLTQNLPKFYERLKELEKKIAELEKRE